MTIHLIHRRKIRGEVFVLVPNVPPSAKIDVIDLSKYCFVESEVDLYWYDHIQQITIDRLRNHRKYNR